MAGYAAASWALRSARSDCRACCSEQAASATRRTVANPFTCPAAHMTDELHTACAGLLQGTGSEDDLELGLLGGGEVGDVS